MPIIITITENGETKTIEAEEFVLLSRKGDSACNFKNCNSLFLGYVVSRLQADFYRSEIKEDSNV